MRGLSKGGGATAGMEGVLRDEVEGGGLFCEEEFINVFRELC